MRAVEWNKKEELVADQALRHLKVDPSIHYNNPYLYQRYWTGTNLECMLMGGISLNHSRLELLGKKPCSGHFQPGYEPNLNAI